MNENITSAPAALVAIDWSDQKHDIALLPAGAERAEYSQLPHRPQNLAEWICGLRQRFDGQKVAIAVEQKRGALIHALMGYEFLQLYLVNPATLSSLRKAFKQSGAKSDPYEVFRRKLAAGDPPNDWTALVQSSGELPQGVLSPAGDTRTVDNDSD